LGSRGKRNWRCQSCLSVVRRSSNKASLGAKLRNPTHIHHIQGLASEILHNGCSRATASRCLFVKAQVHAARQHYSCFKNATWLARYMTLIRLYDISTCEGKGKGLKRQNRQSTHHEGEQGNSSIALHIINTSFIRRPLQPH
jgi:hypothetical protein